MVTQWSTKPGSLRSRTTQNALSTSAEKLLSADPSRRSALIRNLSGTAGQIVYVAEDDTAGPTTGTPLNPGDAVAGESVLVTHQGEIWAEAAAGTPTVSIAETLGGGGN